MRWRYPIVAGAALLAVATSVGLSAARDEPARPVRPADPVVAARPALYVDPQGAAAAQVRTWEQQGRAADAAIIRRIADRPAATWFTDESAGYAERAGRLAAAAAAQNQLPVLTLYHIPNRDCSGHSAGGAHDGAAYRAWVAAIAGALQGRRALVVLEPDAVAQAVNGCLGDAAANERYELLAHAVGVLRTNPGILVYVDAGNPSWIRDPARMGTALRRAGIGQASGFSLNVANFETTGDNIRYGVALSRHLDGAHFVVDTSRNGNGPATVGGGDQHWCNPAGRRLGEAPTTNTGLPLVDAYLWVKRPGESDGACSKGAPPAGQWWPDYALALAR